MTQATRARFAFLVLKDHPYGREMLSQLLAAGFEPQLLIEEDSELAREERSKFEERMAGQPQPASFGSLLSACSVTRRESVETHNGERCERLLAELQPEVIVLGGTRILRENILRQASHGTFNSHPGLLPEVRGSASVAWSIFHDIPLGCTCHLVEKNIDTGPILRRAMLPVRRGQTYEALVHASVALAGRLMVEALQAFVEGSLVGVPQGSGGYTFRVMSAPMVAAVKRKLTDGSYPHLVA